MFADLTIPAWMWWASGALAVGAVLVATAGWLHERNRHRKLDIDFQFDPAGGPRSVGMPTTTMSGGKPFMPPPAPVAPSKSHAGVEKRAAFRRVGNAVLILIADKNGQLKPKQAWVMDRSRRGLRIAVESELVVGSWHAVRPINAPPTTPWSDVEVRHCEHLDGHWEVGCRFRQPPPVQVLMLFG